MIIKRILAVLVVIIIVMACLPISAFATPVLDTDTIQQFGVIIIDISGMADNVNMTYDLTNTESAITVVENLYQTYASETGDPYTLAALSAAALVGGAIAVIYDAVTGQGYIQLYQEEYVSSLDGYWDYQLLDAGLVRDQITDLFNWTLNQSDAVDPINIYAVSNYTYGNVPIHNLGDAPLYYIQGSDFRGFSKTPLVYYCVVTNGVFGNTNQYGDSYSSRIFLMSPDTFTTNTLYSSDRGQSYVVTGNVSGTLEYGQYYYSPQLYIRAYQYYDATVSNFSYETVFGINPTYQQIVTYQQKEYKEFCATGH